MRRLLHILDFADSHPSPCAFFSLDAEKAFDRLEWNYTFYFFHKQHNIISKIKQNKTADTYSTSQGSIKREGEREG